MAEALIVHALFIIFRLLPVGMASGLGGWMGRTLGPRLAASRKAIKNIKMSLPHANADQIARGMWENLGRTMAEYPHLKNIIENRAEIHGYLPDNTEPPYVFFSGHLANWEISPAAMAHFFNIAPRLIYRAPNNPYIENLLNECRSLKGTLVTIPKSRKGARDMVRTLQAGESLGILIDQKYNEGIPAEFFGRAAMTSTAFVQLAQKFNLPLVPVRPERIGGCRFKVTVYPPIATQDRAVEDVVADAHRLLESWIEERPEQWLWLHRRWGF